jgi:hypothetical protein
MSDAPLSPNPLGDAAATEDQVGLAAAAIVSGFALAVALLSLVTWWTFRLAIASGIDTVEGLSPNAAQVNVITYGVPAVLAATGALAWWLMRPIASTYRRFGLSMVAVLGGFVLGMVVTTLVREFAGVSLLPGVASVASVLTLLAVRRTRRLAEPSSA